MQKTTASDPLKWANALVNNPISLTDDYGNLVISTGLALQQKPQERQGLESPLRYDASSEKVVNDQSSNAFSLQSRPSRKACSTCHARKVKCDISQTGGGPCKNCRKAQRQDCTLHQRRGRDSNRKTTTSVTAPDNEGVGSSESVEQDNTNSISPAESLTISGPQTVCDIKPSRA